LKIAYYEFSETYSLIPLPDGYVESSSGNFAYFVIDSNIFRVVDMTLFVATINAIVIGTLRIIYYLKENSRLQSISCIHNLSKFTKKSIYRLLEFFYKTCMYPLLFCALINISNWNARIMVNEYTFRYASLGVSIAIIVAYIIVTIWQWFEEIAAKVNRIENVCEFISAILAAIVLTFTIHSDLFLLLIILFSVRAFVYVWTRKLLLRDFSKFEYFKVLTTLFEVATLCLVTSQSTAAVGSFVFLTITLQVIHETVIVTCTAKRAILDKIKKDQEEAAGNPSFQIMGSEADSSEKPSMGVLA